jgi:hypothetical protein
LAGIMPRCAAQPPAGRRSWTLDRSAFLSPRLLPVLLLIILLLAILLLLLLLPILPQ